jgi:phenylacetate-CoA ligase
VGAARDRAVHDPWPAFIAGKGATLRGAVDGLVASERWSAAELEAGQRRQLLQLLRAAVKNVPWYDRSDWARGRLAALEAAGDGFWEEWRAIPLLGKPELRAHGDALGARTLAAAQQPVGTVRTSGSTGIPVEIRTTAVSRLAWNAMTVREHLWRRRDFGKRLGVCRSRGPEQRAPGGHDAPGWGPPVAGLWRTGRGSAIHIGLDVPLIEAWLRRFDPHYLLTYPSLAAELLARMGPGGRPPSLEEVRLMSEPLDAALEQRFVAEWGVKVADVYSANEVGNIAFRCHEDRLHVQPETILVEILDDKGRPCAPGENGRVVVTPLHNLATPLLRYDLGDYATVGAPCPCGRAHPVIEKVLGRVRNMAVAPDGRRFWPPALLRVRTVAAIRQFQYVQVAPDAIELRVVVDRPLTPAEEAEAAARVRSVLGYPYRVVVRPVAGIPRGPTGKFEEFLSELPA